MRDILAASFDNTDRIEGFQAETDGDKSSKGDRYWQGQSKKKGKPIHRIEKQPTR